ncbi:hypothetical protein PVAP13_7KG233255 [Panicum virgatum]|uniref:Uncharacterized protein n=1 Tax=Panicum virgatum TaxID=38727 RepID=A0A8T0QHM6_PANVG|nr:hypothetical protein PVAP13_7KG233255 [Panicum virgatum]
MNAMVDSIKDAVENAIIRGNQSGGVRRFMVQGVGHWNGTITSGGADATSAAKERQRRRHGWTSWGTSVPHQRRRCREVATGLRLRHQCRASTPNTAAPPALLRRHRLQSPQCTPIRERGRFPASERDDKGRSGPICPGRPAPWPACLGGERRRRPSPGPG